MDTNKKPIADTTDKAPESGKVALTMGAFSIAFFFILSIIFTIVHNSFF